MQRTWLDSILEYEKHIDEMQFSKLLYIFVYFSFILVLFGRQLGKCCKLHHNSNCTSSVGVIRAYVAPNYLALTCCTEVVTGIGYWNGRDIEREKAICDFLSLYGKRKIY